MFASDNMAVIARRDRKARKHPETPGPPRWLLITRRLYEGGTITLRYLMDEFGVSLATAKRDLVLIEAHLPTVRDPRERRSDPVKVRLLLVPRVSGRIIEDET